MSRYVLILLICLIQTMCSEKKQETTVVTVKERITSIDLVPLTDDDPPGHFYPRFSPDGQRVLTTSSNYRGLSYIDVETKTIVALNDYPGAGFDYCFSHDNSSVYFRADTMINRRRFINLFRQNMDTRRIDQLNSQPLRNISGLHIGEAGSLLFWQDDILKFLDFTSGQIQPANENGLHTRILGDRIIRYSNGTHSTVRPFPDQNLIWMDQMTSPNTIIIYVAGGGLYIIDLNNHHTHYIGDYRAPHLSPNKKFIAFMKDADDGHQVTESDIFVARLNDNKIYPITQSSDEIEMYPRWSHDGKKLVFHTTRGRIKMAHLTLESK